MPINNNIAKIDLGLLTEKNNLVKIEAMFACFKKYKIYLFTVVKAVYVIKARQYVKRLT